MAPTNEPNALTPTPSSTDLGAVLGDLVREAIRQEFDDAPADVDPVVRPSKFADYQVNGALPLAKVLGRPPREIADGIARHLLMRSDILSAADVSGPGFINCTFTNDFLASIMATQIGDDRLGRPRTPEPKVVVVDYGSPNVAKEMHVGHLRSSVIGDALVRIIASRGDEVIRQNHLGDWGTQFGMLIEYMVDQGATNSAEDMQVSDLEELYRSARKQFDGDDAFKERARDRVVALQGGDPESMRLWTMLVNESKRHFEEVFSRLGTLLTDEDYRGESIYNDMLDDTVAELEKKGLTEISEGALCVFPEGFKGPDDKPFPLIVRKTNGGYGYAATDLAAIRYNREHDHANEILYVTDGRQAQHFAMVIAVARKAGWLDDNMTAMHVPHGMVLGNDGKPFKTRTGGTVRLIELIEEAVSKAEEVLRARESDFTDEEIHNIAEAVGVGAIKWTDLKNNRMSDYVFDPDAMTSFDGNTGPYIQYAATRARSVLRRAGITDVGNDFVISEPAERELALHLAEYGGAIERVIEDYEPHHLCTYLFELAGRFSGFYENCPVLTAESPEIKASRLALCALTARVLDDGLAHLGMQSLERM